MIKRKIILGLILAAIVIYLIEYSGLFTMVRELDYRTEFKYPIEGDITRYIAEMKQGSNLSIKPFDNHNVNFLIKNEKKCITSNNDGSNLPLRIVYIVKSAIANVENRKAIRRTWGFENRFADVEIRTVFLLGYVHGPNKFDTHATIVLENEKFHDIIQGDFIDTYYNNTMKTLMGIRWAAEFCSNSRFYLYVDDDYYVSTRNILRFLRNPPSYPKYLENPTIDFNDVQKSNRLNTKLKNGKKLNWPYQNTMHPISSGGNRKLQQLVDFDLPEDVELYAGYVFFPKPHRHKLSKWYISLEEYPYDKYPPFINAGAYVLSNEALKKFYYASYFVQKFRFDDVYLGIIAKKLEIEPFHSDEFWFYRKYPYNVNDFSYTIASHEFSNPKKMEKIWNQQKQAGNA